MKDYKFKCQWCGREYKINWKDHDQRCYRNPDNLKLFARWVEKLVREKSSDDAFYVKPFLKELDTFCRTNNTIGILWILEDIGRHGDTFESVAVVLEDGIMNNYITEDDISREIIYQYDSRLFLSATEFEKRMESFTNLENMLLGYQ